MFVYFCRLLRSSWRCWCWWFGCGIVV